MNWFHPFFFCETNKLLELYKNTPYNKQFPFLEREEGGKEFVARLTALSKFARKTVLKINWSVKTSWHERMEFARSG